MDIDKFSEYDKLVGKFLDEVPSKLMVFVNLEDVKKSAKVCI